MMAGKFKKGDRVRLISDAWRSVCEAGHEVIVECVRSGGIEFKNAAGVVRWAPFGMIELIPPFAYGDRVRLTANEQGGYAGKGDTGKVIKADSGERDSLVEFSNGEGWYIPWDIMEAVPVFKVGDRVRFTDKVSKFFWFGPHTEYHEGTITAVGRLGYAYDVRVCEGRTAYVDAIHIEHLAAKDSNPLRIEAGKFYKTRDGRRVLVDRNGVYEDGDDYPWMHDCGRGGYHALDANGKSCIYSDQDDIVAEWPA